MAGKRDYGAEALKLALETSSQAVRLEERLDAVEAEVKRISPLVPLLAPQRKRQKMPPEIALASKRRAMAEAMKSRWKDKTPPPPASPPKKRRRKKRAPA